MSRLTDSPNAESPNETPSRSNVSDRIPKKRSPKKPLRRNLIIGTLLAVLVALMLWDTQFLTAEEVDALSPDEFDPAVAAQELFDEAEGELAQEGHELGAVAEALAEDSEAAAEEFDSYTPSEGTEVFAVSATGTVNDATEDTLTLEVDSVPEDRSVVIPLGNALDGDLVRDVAGFDFGDAPGQTEYQQVGNELSELLRTNAQEALGDDPSAIEGENVTVSGFLRHVTTDGDDSGGGPLIIQVLQVEVSL